jgi:glutathione synthase/RimK-type ligase-like ATP-grasp enzyme
VLLLVTNRNDLTADWLIIELERRGTPYLRFNTEDYPSAVRLRWQEDGRAALRIAGVDHPLGRFAAVWYRRPVPPTVASEDQAVADWASREAKDALDAVWRTHDALWVNHPEKNLRAGSKPEQLLVARRLGFEVPASLVTNDLGEATAFARRHRRLVCKALVDGLVETVNGPDRLLWTSEVAEGDLADLSDFGPEPYFFQELVPKSCDVRVTVIGDDVFGVRIASQNQAATRLDWRRGPTAELAHEVESLPRELAARCRTLVEHYGLLFGAIDLGRRPDGGYTFFELNPNGQWAWLEHRTGLPLRSRLADLLESAL